MQQDDSGQAWNDDPEIQRWLDRVHDEVVPMIDDSFATISIAPRGQTDMKFAVELGLSIMMGKPIIVAVWPGVQIPAGLTKVADEIVEVDPSTDPAVTSEAFQAAISRVAQRQGLAE